MVGINIIKENSYMTSTLRWALLLFHTLCQESALGCLTLQL
jgi:hypothetical protein